MLRLSSDITIGRAIFDFVNMVEVVSSWENLTDTARIILPNNIRPKVDGEVSFDITAGDAPIWKRGDAVTINLGYDDNNAQIFKGRITQIRPSKPLEFLCEDEMYTLKQAGVKYSTSSATLKSLMAAILPDGITVETEDISLGKFTVTNASVAEVLDYLRKKFGLSAYFLPSGSLYVGFAYKDVDSISTDNLSEFEFYKNIIDESQLDYTRDDDANFKVTAYNIKPDNTRTKIEVGDTLGEQRTLYFYDVSDSDLTKLATESLEKMKYDGFVGSFLTFLQPTVRHGQAIKMIDPEIPDRNGVYLVRKVVTQFGIDGGRQEITLDRKIA